MYHEIYSEYSIISVAISSCRLFRFYEYKLQAHHELPRKYCASNVFDETFRVFIKYLNWCNNNKNISKVSLQQYGTV